MQAKQTAGQSESVWNGLSLHIGAQRLQSAMLKLYGY
jgi:hypothetical protein